MYSIQESILNCIYSHRQFWRCFQSHRTFSVKDRDASNKSQHWPRLQYNYDVPKMESYPTRDCCPVQSDEVKLTLKKMIENLILGELYTTNWLKPCIYINNLYIHKNAGGLFQSQNIIRITKHLFINYLFYKNIWINYNSYKYNISALLFVWGCFPSS